ncbi:cap-specific mRNA (nucleoside-2'-O-)-methyltransferase 2 [Vanessa tameamea]|uniref:Cap-specific mRNA (nucleoside-2'-O-)-methyltransferase 2 n=1 Tax=Vanessa tameamea TaxID=334116 RepID=A0A8B8IVE2_VANTA|nr:cap-specific mRNA (nucleoside-2'-O-)-methyltransferase 2 [Vanessa tameamea]
MFQKPENVFSRHKFFRPDDFDDELNDLFNKKYQFRFNSEWKLPDREFWFSAPPWKVKALESQKSRLNFHKSQLNDFSIEEWSSHTRRRNPAGEVGWKIRCLVNPEFLTQAWTKFYECACTYNVVPKEASVSKRMISLHLCEAPGAFITSLNHYLKLNHQDIQWKWVANTLNPYYEGNSPSNMISDDRFMFHTLDNWHFGKDSTGNLMDWENSQAVIEKAKSLGKVLLVTADGSIDCMQKPDAQEEVTSPLHYCEIVTALQSLSSGGTLIFKLFTIFEHSTVCLLYLINHLFKEVNIYKPVTSRQGNSEVYAVCLQYKDNLNLNDYIPILKSTFGTDLYSKLAMFPLEMIPETFLKQIEECSYYFCSIQCQVINSNLQAYLMQKNIALHRDIKKIRAIVASEFIWKYNLKPILYEHEILKGILHEENKINTNPRYYRGSYTERQLYSKMSLKEKLKNLNGFLQAELLSNPLILINESIRWMFKEENVKLEIKYTYGLPLQKINSSKFIFVPIFKLYQQILAEEEFKEIIIYKQSKGHMGSTDDSKSQISKILLLPEYQYKDSFNVYEKNCFKTLLSILKEMKIGESLLLKNFNILTHFNVSTLFILSKGCFEKTGFASCGSIVLNNLQDKSFLNHLDVINIECDKVRSDNTKDVLNSLPVQVTNVGEFFNNIVFYNNTFYRNKCIEYLYTIEQSL